MRKLDTDYLDEFKAVEAICGDMFGTRAGVSEYIKAMEEVPDYKRSLVEGWDSSYKELKHLRWVRNKIANEPDFDECEKEDLRDLKLFHSALLKGLDPLARLAKAEKEMERLRKRKSASSYGSGSAAGSGSGGSGYEGGHSGMWVAAVLVIIAAVLLAVRFL